MPAAPTWPRCAMCRLNECTLLLVTKRNVGIEIPAQVFTEDYLVHPGAD